LTIISIFNCISRFKGKPGKDGIPGRDGTDGRDGLSIGNISGTEIECPPGPAGKMGDEVIIRNPINIYLIVFRVPKVRLVCRVNRDKWDLMARLVSLE
jgi:hypothetical protein